MTIRPDLTAYDREGQAVLVVEVKAKRGTDNEWAAQIRRNMLVHGLTPIARYFLLALPDRFYLWKDRQLPELEEPTYEIDPTSLLKPYLERAGVGLENLSGAGFELLIFSWLNDLTHVDELPDALKSEHGWLIESGLYEAINQGQVALVTA